MGGVPGYPMGGVYPGVAWWVCTGVAWWGIPQGVSWWVYLRVYPGGYTSGCILVGIPQVYPGGYSSLFLPKSEGHSAHHLSFSQRVKDTSARIFPLRNVRNVQDSPRMTLT